MSELLDRFLAQHEPQVPTVEPPVTNPQGLGGPPTTLELQREAPSSPTGMSLDAPVNLDAFIQKYGPIADEAHKHRANQLLGAFHEGQIDLTPEWRDDLIKSAYQGTSAAGTVAKTGIGIIDALSDSGGTGVPGAGLVPAVAQTLWSGAKTGIGAIQHLSTAMASPTSTEGQTAGKDIVAGGEAGLVDVANVAQSLIYGGMNIADQFPGHEERRLKNIGASEQASHDYNKGIAKNYESLGANPEDPLSQTSRFVSQAALPLGVESKAGTGIAKAADYAIERAPEVSYGTGKGIKNVAPGVGGAALYLSGHPVLASEVLAAGYGLPSLSRSKIGSFVKKLIGLAKDDTPAAQSEFSQVLDGIKNAPYQTPTYTYIKEGLDEEVGRMQHVIDTLRSQNADKLVNVDNPKFKLEDLKGPDKEIRAKMDEMKKLQDKGARINLMSDLNKALTYTGKLGLTMAGDAGVAGTVMAGISASQAQPENVEEAAKRGFTTGVAMSAPFVPFQASSKLRDIRAEAGREAFKEIGKDAISPDHPNYDAHQQAYSNLKPEGQDAIDVASGMLKSMGGKGVVILPKEEFLKMQGGDASKAPGRGFVRDGTIYLNAESISQGVIGHEISHFLPQALGQSALDILPDLKAKMGGKNTSQAYKDFESYYNSLAPEKGNIPEEVLAETGRRVLTDMPPELFYGGESGADVLKRWGGKILSKVAPEWYHKNQIDSVLKAPISKADEAAVRSKLFEIGQRKGQEPPRNAPDEPSATIIPLDTSKPPTGPPVSVEPPIGAPSGAVEALIGLGEKKASAQAKVDAATAEILSENGQPTLEEVVRRAVQKTVPTAFENLPSLRSASEFPTNPPALESSLSQAKAPTEAKSEPPSTPTSPVPIEETPSQSSPEKIAPLTKNIVASPEIKTDTPPVSSENPMLIGPRTDKYGRKSVSGRIFDPELPEHAALAEKAGLDAENIAKLKELSDKMGETVGIDYSHAPEEGLGRKESQKKTLAQARIEGAKREKLSKTFVPTWIEFTSGTNKAIIRGFSPDKFYENASKVFENHPEVMEPYSGVNDPKLTQDFQNYAENHANGYTGMGKPIEGTELTPVKQNPDHQPHVIPEDRANVINVLMGDTSAGEGIRKPSPVKLEKRALAKANAPFFDPTTGETNKIRATKGDMGLESVSETLRPELIDKIREPYVEDVHTIRPSGAAPETRASLAKAGTPRSDYVASGFFPGGGEEPFKGKTIEAGEQPWSIRLKELETREWNGAKLTDPEQKELLDLHKQAKEEYGSYANWFEKMGAEKDYTSEVFGDEKQKPTQFMPDSTPMTEEKIASLPERQRMMAEEAKSVGAELWDDGTVTVYHATTIEKAKQIAESGTLTRPSDASDSYGVYVSSSPSVAQDYGDGTLVKLRVKLSDLNPDDIFPGRRMDFSIKTREGKYTPAEIQHMPASDTPVPAPKSPPKIKSLRAVKPPEKKKDGPEWMQRIEYNQVDSTKNGGSGRKMEFYAPDDPNNPKPGKPTVEVFDASMGAKDISGELLSHYLPTVDKTVADIRQKILDGITAKQRIELRADYDAAKKSGLVDEGDSFNAWLKKQGGDAFFRGFPTGQWPASVYTSAQTALYGKLEQYLRSDNFNPKKKKLSDAR